MKGNTENIHGVLAEMLIRLDSLNVGKLQARKNNRNANGKAEGKSRLSQQLS